MDDKKSTSTIDDVLNYLKTFKEDVAKDNKLIEKKVDKIEEQIEEKLNKMKRQMEENRTKGTNMMEEITRRMDNLEREAFEKKTETAKVKDAEKLKKRTEDRKKEELKRRRREEEQMKKNALNEKTLQDELREASEIEDKTEVITEDTVEKEFEIEAVEWLNTHVKSKTISQEEEDRKIKKKKMTGMKKLKNWFCDSEEEEELSSEEEEKAGEKEWEAVDRKEKNRKRKEKRRERDIRMRSETASKASKIVGIGPITKDTIKHFERINENLEKAKLAAVEEYLQHYLNYSNREIKELSIKDTKHAKDEIVYVVFEDQGDIRELYGRMAQSKNDELVTRNFVPPQFFNRYMHISAKCKELRDTDPAIKTQMRFGKHDVEVLTKSRGSRDPYKLAPLHDICKGENIPDFDVNIKWHHKKDRLQRQDIFVSPNKGLPPSMWQEDDLSKGRHPLSRTSSHNDAPKKRLRKEDDEVVTVAGSNSEVDMIVNSN